MSRKVVIGVIWGVVGGVLLFVWAATAGPARAQGIDWRAALTCPPEYQLHDGVQYCLGQDAFGADVHVIVVDLASPTVRFEYILPEGQSNGHEGIQECRDPNRPEWAGPAGGCFVPGDTTQYPTMTLIQAVDRAKEVYNDKPVVAVINADYGASNENHGAEGLLVVRGTRLDGAANCDDDYNAALRPWLGLGESQIPASGLIRADINRLETDGSPIPEWLYTGIGGGPMLVQNGLINGGAATCSGQTTLTRIDPVMNCTGNLKATPLQKAEGYASGSCRQASHTAAGLSADRRWLFLAITTGQNTPEVMATFLIEELGVVDALKFDGGGSSQFWLAGEPNLEQYVGGERRSLSNFLAVYTDTGRGVSLPLSASSTGGVQTIFLDEGESGSMDVNLVNDGPLTWRIEDGVALTRRPAIDLPTNRPELFPLPHDITPNGTAAWSLPIEPGRGVRTIRYQMIQDETYFGQQKQFLVIVIPEALKDKREELEALIAELQAQGVQEAEELGRAVEEWLLTKGAEMAEGALRRLARFVGNLLERVWRAVEAELAAFCNSLVLVPVAMGAVWLRRRRR